MSTKFQKLVFFWIQRCLSRIKELYTKIYRKQTNWQSFLHINSEHPKLLKDSFPYSQALWIKWICTTSKNFEHHCKELKRWFFKQGYKTELLGKHIKTVEKLDRNELIKGNKIDKPINTCISLAITFNRFFANISKIIWKNKFLKNVFQNEPVTAFKRTKNLKELTGSKNIKNNIVEGINKSTLKPGKGSPCFRNSRTLCCNQVITTLAFKSQHSQKLIHESNCSSTYVIYLIECILCKQQYVRKAETPFNIRLNNHRNDVESYHFYHFIVFYQEKKRNLKKHVKFISYTNLPKQKNLKKLCDTA